MSGSGDALHEIDLLDPSQQDMRGLCGKFCHDRLLQGLDIMRSLHDRSA